MSGTLPGVTLQLDQPHRRTTVARNAHPGWVLAAVLLVALNLRIGITSLGALLDEVTRGTGMSAPVAAFATTLPVLCFAVVGATGIRVARTLGPHRGLALALVALALGLGLRITGGATVLLLGSLAAYAGIALANVLLPVVVKQHFPGRVGEVTGAYSAVLSLGAALGAGVTVPVASATHGWRGGLGVWVVVAAIAMLAWLPQGRNDQPSGERRDARALLRSPLAWAVTMVFGTQSLLAYVVMSWLPSMYADAGFTARQSGLLLAGSILVGVPVFLVVPSLATRLRSQGPLIAALSLLLAAGFAGLWVAPHQGAWAWAALIGIGGGVFPVTLTMFALRTSSAHDTAALSTMAQSIGYLLAAAGPFLVGVLHDASGSWAAPYALLIATCLVQVGIGCVAGRPLVIGSDSRA
jgi:CP family cyanate transporter-like MFS transporter